MWPCEYGLRRHNKRRVTA
ncbi:hypothetical protein Golax_003209 [Gossypium laxum]|uniref:Uncharacterized protein n=1 Tax=Gossypium laxum TaxID=34288 RepID=A0A7J9AER0_9ROSI|nr:hypothetical protein [Gossypium laxum]